MTLTSEVETKAKLTFEQFEKLLLEFAEKSRTFRRQFETIRDRAERIQRDIASAQKAGDECLERYRSCLNDGRKIESEQFLEKVSKHRKEAQRLNTTFPGLLKEMNRLTQVIEGVRKQVLQLSETGILIDLKKRLDNAFNATAGLLHDCSHVSGQINKLYDYIKNK